jgi:hypothetical protein
MDAFIDPSGTGLAVFFHLSEEVKKVQKLIW